MDGNLTSPADVNSEWKFNSVVCFDLETTGLPQFERPVRITEIALVGIVRTHLKSDSTDTLPRVLHKLNLTVYPRKSISFEASHVTGLWNDLLEPIKPWNLETCQMVIAFLNTLPPPVCIVAHNGFKFDFPILKQHLEKINQVLPDHIIFVDSLPAFQKLLGEDPKKSSSLIDKMIKDMDSDNDILIKAAEEIEASLGGVFSTKQPEVTPDSKIVSNNPNLQVKRRSEGSSVSSNVKVSDPNKAKVRKCLFPSKQPVSYKLMDIYSHLFNCPMEGAHNAEADAITLLKCILKVSPEFLKYANTNYITFESVSS